MDKEVKQKKQITLYVKEAVDVIQAENVNTDSALTSQDSTNGLCHALEAALLHGLKGSSSEKNFWGLIKRYTHSGTVKSLQELSQISTDIGRCRAWVRQAINDLTIEGYINMILEDKDTLRNYYRPTAYLRDIEESAFLQTHIQGLSSFTFDLSVNSTVLNQWTTTTLVLSGLVSAGLLQRPLATASQYHAGAAIPAAARSVGQPIQAGRHAVSHSHSTGRLSGSSAMTPSTSTPSTSAGKKRKPRVVNISSGDDHNMSASLSCPQGLKDISVSLNDSLQLSRSDIDAMRELRVREGGRLGGEEGSASTPDSLLSRPDFTDARQDLYNLTFGVTPESSEADNDQVMSSEELERKFHIVMSNLDTLPLDYDQKVHEKFAKYEDRGRAIRPRFQAGDDDEDEDTDQVPQSSAPSSSSIYEEQENASAEGKESAGSQVETTAALGVVMKAKSGDMGAQARDTKPQGSVYGANASSMGAQTDVTGATPDSTGSPAVSSDVSLQLPTGEGLEEGRALDDVEKGDKSPRSPPIAIPGTPSMFRHPDIKRDTATNNLSMSLPAVKRVLQQSSGVAGSADKSSAAPAMHHEGSFSSLFDNFVPMGEIVTVQEIINSLPNENAHLNSSSGGRGSHLNVGSAGRGEESRRNSHRSGTAPDSEGDLNERYSPSTDTVATQDDNDSTTEMLKCMQELRTELGLREQCYQCKGCVRPLGIIFGNARLCEFTGYSYCYECHENEEHCLPAHIIYNWDFRPHLVSKASLKFLRDMFDRPLLDLQQLNMKLYDHVPELARVRDLRRQLVYLKSYIYSCRHPSSKEFKVKVLNKVYLVADQDVYSTKDLTQVPSGALASKLEKWLACGVSHVYECKACSLKGFYCEICRDDKIIFPFETETTTRCDKCFAVYHKECKTSLMSCPKCVRRLKYGK